MKLTFTPTPDGKYESQSVKLASDRFGVHIKFDRDDTGLASVQVMRSCTGEDFVSASFDTAGGDIYDHTYVGAQDGLYVKIVTTAPVTDADLI